MHALHEQTRHDEHVTADRRDQPEPILNSPFSTLAHYETGDEFLCQWDDGCFKLACASKIDAHREAKQLDRNEQLCAHETSLRCARESL